MERISLSNVTHFDNLCFSVGQDRETNQHCIRMADTECDLSNSLRELNATYAADILSEPLRGATSDLVEFPSTSAPRFCPYKDSRYPGRPMSKCWILFKCTCAFWPGSIEWMVKSLKCKLSTIPAVKRNRLLLMPVPLSVTHSFVISPSSSHRQTRVQDCSE